MYFKPPLGNYIPSSYYNMKHTDFDIALESGCKSKAHIIL